MLRSDKERVVARLAERLRDTDTLMVADYRGLSMPEIDELRSRLLEAGARFTVVKNTLTKLAAEEAGAKDVLVIRGGLLEGALVGDAEIKRLATLPPTDVLRAQVTSAVAAPLTTVVGLFAAPLRELVGILDARIHQLEELGETTEVPAGEEQVAEEEPKPEEPEHETEEQSGEAEQASAEESEEE